MSLLGTWHGDKNKLGRRLGAVCGDRQGDGRQQHDAGARRRIRDRPRRRALFAGAGSYPSRAAFSDGFVAAILELGRALLGTLAGAALPARRAAGSVTVAPVLEGEG